LTELTRVSSVVGGDLATISQQAAARASNLSPTVQKALQTALIAQAQDITRNLAATGAALATGLPKLATTLTAAEINSLKSAIVVANNLAGSLRSTFTTVTGQLSGATRTLAVTEFNAALNAIPSVTTPLTNYAGSVTAAVGVVPTVLTELLGTVGSLGTILTSILQLPTVGLGILGV
jgi:hypothetical protein